MEIAPVTLQERDRCKHPVVIATTWRIGSSSRLVTHQRDRGASTLDTLHKREERALRDRRCMSALLERQQHAVDSALLPAMFSCVFF